MALVPAKVRTLAIIYASMEHKLVEKLQQKRNGRAGKRNANPSRNLLAPILVQ
jgi:hypothetical protein